MNKTSSEKTKPSVDEMRNEYRINQNDTHLNCFTKTKKEDRIENVLDSELSQVFKTPGPVRKVLRALFTTMPKN